MRYLAIAASLVLAVAVGAFYGTALERTGTIDAGSLVVIAEQGRNTPGLATHISRQLEFPPSVSL